MIRVCFGYSLWWSLNILWHCLSLELEWKLTFTSPVANVEFSKFADTLTASLFRILNSSAGIPSPPLVLFPLMLPKAHLTSYSRMSGSRWVTTPSWLSTSLQSSLYSSFVYSYRLFLISCFCFVLTVSVPYHAHPCVKCSLDISNWAKESLVFPVLLFSSMYSHYSLKRLSYLSLLLWNSVFRWVYLSLSPLTFAFAQFYSFHKLAR